MIIAIFESFDGFFETAGGHLFYTSSGENYDQDPIDGDPVFDFWVVSNGSSVNALPSDHIQVAGASGSLVYLWSPGDSAVCETIGTMSGAPPAFDFSTIGISLGQIQQAGSEFFTGSDSRNAGVFGITDLTTNGTHLLPAAPTSCWVRWATALFFSASDTVHGNEPWISDGTTNGTTLLKDIAPGSDGTPPAEAVAVGGNLFFSVQPLQAGGQLWKSDGTTAGTILIRSFNLPAPARLISRPGTEMFIFSANDGTNGMELWAFRTAQHPAARSW